MTLWYCTSSLKALKRTEVSQEQYVCSYQLDCLTGTYSCCRFSGWCVNLLLENRYMETRSADMSCRTNEKLCALDKVFVLFQISICKQTHLHYLNTTQYTAFQMLLCNYNSSSKTFLTFTKKFSCWSWHSSLLPSTVLKIVIYKVF